MNTQQPTPQPRFMRIVCALVGLLLGSWWLNGIPLVWSDGVLAARLAAADAPLGDQAEAAPGVTVLSVDEQGMVVELRAGKLAVEEIQAGGESFHRLTLPDSEGSETPGAPQVPQRSTLLGVPTTGGITLEVLPTEAETRNDLRIAPAPRLALEGDPLEDGNAHIAERFVFDAARYNTAELYPGPLAEVGDAGYMRDQAVVRVTFYPVQYDPVQRSVQFYPRLRVRLRWPAQAQAASAPPRGASAAYEALLRSTLLNYPTLGRVASVSTLPVQSSNAAAPAQANDLPRLKISVQVDGVYQLTYAALTQAGFVLDGVDPRRLQLTNRGQPVPGYLVGEEDGRFDPADYLLFYGTAISADIYTTTNVYWLAVADQAGQRMTVREGAATGVTTTPDRFPVTIHAEKDTIYWSQMPDAQPDEDRWFWEARLSFNTTNYPAARVYPITLPQVAQTTGETATLRLRLKGHSLTDHQIQVTVNDHLIPGPQSWSGRSEYTFQAPVPATWLKAGENLVEVKLIPNPTSSPGLPDSVLVNWLEIDTWQRYAANADQLRFTPTPAGRQLFQVGNFTAGAVIVLDISTPAAPVRLINPSVQAGQGRWQVGFAAETAPAPTYLVASANGYRKPANLKLDEPSDLGSVRENYLIITHADFYTSALKLAAHRQANFSVKTIKIDDIYDEFTFGIANPQAIRSFLTAVYSRTRQTAPDYVLLLGDATVDYRGNLTPPTRNFVPTQVVPSPFFGEVPSDHWFVTVHGDDLLPEMFIGRLSAQDATEAERMVERIINYDKFPPSAPWNKQILLVADDDESKFTTNSDELATALPLHGYISKTVYLKDKDYVGQPLATVRNKIINFINDGAILVNYFGHGTHFAWGIPENVNDVDNPEKYIFHNQYIPQLTNQARLPVFTIANCLNGAFAGTADRPALAEQLQRSPTGGAIAVWAPTSLGFPTGHKELLGHFYDAVFLQDQKRLGEAAAIAKINALSRSERWQELVRTYILFGDPATAIGLPLNAPYITAINPPPNTPVALDQPIAVSFSKPMAAETVALTTGEGKLFTLMENQANRTFVFTHSGLTYGTTYTLQVQGQDRAGLPLVAGPLSNPWTLTTVVDSRPQATIELVSTLVGIARPADRIRITFSEPVLPGTLAPFLTPWVEGEFIWSSDGKQVEFVHENFRAGQTYTFELRGVQDVTGNGLAAVAKLTFSVVKESLYLPQVFKR